MARIDFQNIQGKDAFLTGLATQDTGIRRFSTGGASIDRFMHLSSGNDALWWNDTGSTSANWPTGQNFISIPFNQIFLNGMTTNDELIVFRDNNNYSIQRMSGNQSSSSTESAGGRQTVVLTTVSNVGTAGIGSTVRLYRGANASGNVFTTANFATLPDTAVSSERTVTNSNGAIVPSSVGNLVLRALTSQTTIGIATPAITGTHDLGGFGVGRTHDVEFTAANAGTATFRAIAVGDTIRVTASLATAGNSVDATVVSITPRTNGLVDFMFRVTVINGTGIPLSPGTISVALISTGERLATAVTITPSATNLPLVLNLGDVINVASGTGNSYFYNEFPSTTYSI